MVPKSIQNRCNIAPKLQAHISFIFTHFFLAIRSQKRPLQCQKHILFVGFYRLFWKVPVFTSSRFFLSSAPSRPPFWHPKYLKIGPGMASAWHGITSFCWVVLGPDFGSILGPTLGICLALFSVEVFSQTQFWGPLSAPMFLEMLIKPFVLATFPPSKSSKHHRLHIGFQEASLEMLIKPLVLATFSHSRRRRYRPPRRFFLPAIWHFKITTH
jgi:hypothetical protein